MAKLEKFSGGRHHINVGREWTLKKAEEAEERLLGSMAVVEKYNKLLTTHLAPTVAQFIGDRKLAKSQLGQLRSMEAFLIMPIVWRNSLTIYSDYNGETISLETTEPDQITRHWLANRLARTESPVAQPAATSKHINTARRIVDAGIGFKLFEETELRSNCKPIVGTNRLDAFMESLVSGSNALADHLQDCQKTDQTLSPEDGS